MWQRMRFKRLVAVAAMIAVGGTLLLLFLVSLGDNITSLDIAMTLLFYVVTHSRDASEFKYQGIEERHVWNPQLHKFCPGDHRFPNHSWSRDVSHPERDSAA
jgi:hypothetical protein